MRVRYSFSSRRTRRTKNIRKQRQKFPLVLKKIVEASNIILQILDARFVKETRNLEIEKLIKEKNKKIIYVLNKSDLIDEKTFLDKNEQQLQEISPYILISAKERTGGKKLRDLIKIESKNIKEEALFEGKVIVGVIGYPNTGKSSLINMLIGKSSAKTGADAGFTKAMQKLKLSSSITLLDSPGVIPEKEYSGTEKKQIAQHTKVGARSYSQLRDPETVVASLIKEYPNVFEKYYKISAKGDSEALLEELGRKHNFLKKGNEVNFDKTARLILKDWQEGNIKL